MPSVCDPQSCQSCSFLSRTEYSTDVLALQRDLARQAHHRGTENTEAHKSYSLLCALCVSVVKATLVGILACWDELSAVGRWSFGDLTNGLRRCIISGVERRSVARRHRPKWRNWQTRYVQGVVRVTSSEFKSPLRHQRSRQPAVSSDTPANC